MKEWFNTATQPNLKTLTAETSNVRIDRCGDVSLTSFLATNLASNPHRSMRKGPPEPLKTSLGPTNRAPDPPVVGLGRFIHVRKRLVLPIRRRYSQH